MAIDDKTVCHSYDKANGKGAIHMVSAWASANRLVLGQRKVDEKSNEKPLVRSLRILQRDSFQFEGGKLHLFLFTDKSFGAFH